MRLALVSTVVVAACSADPGSVTLTAYPVRVLADGRDTTTVIATVRDTAGHPLANTHVSLAVTGSENTLGTLDGTTDDDGVLVSTLRSTTGETKTVTATAGGHTATHDVSFMPVPPCQGIPRIGGAPALRLPAYATGDLDEDGKVDAIVLGDVEGVHGIEMLRGLGDGTFADPILLYEHGGDAMRVVDVDNDGHLDLAFAASSWSAPGPPKAVTLLLGNGDGTLRPPVELPVADHATSIGFADFDGDGHLDIAAGSFSDDQQTLTISALFGHGDGTFEPYTNLAVFPSTVHELDTYQAIGDLDGDGRADLVVWEYTSTIAHVFYGNADRTFGAASLDTTTPLYEQMVAVADIDADGRADLLVISDGQQSALDVWLGHPDRTLAAQPTTTWPTGGQIVAADIDGDGKLDLVRPNDYLRGNGDGTFVQGPTYAAGNGYPILLADLDANGSLDVIQFEPVYLNDKGVFRVPTTYDDPGSYLYAVGDFDNDGVVDIVQANARGVVAARRGHGDGTFDAGFVLLAGGIYPPAQGNGVQIGDVNRDGNADIVTRATDGTISVELGHGDGTFELLPATANLPGLFWSLVDLDNDGKLDVASGISVLRGKGDGTFAALITSDPGYLPDFRGGYADINADGFPDLIVFDSINTMESGFYLGNGDGTFQPVLPLPVVPGNIMFAAGDFNNDGLVDIFDAGNPQVLLNQGNDTFAPITNPWGLGPQYAVDIDRDGNLDIVASDGSVSLGDGSGDFAHPFAYVEAGVPVDVDGDGQVDLLNGWQFARQQGCFSQPP